MESSKHRSFSEARFNNPCKINNISTLFFTKLTCRRGICSQLLLLLPLPLLLRGTSLIFKEWMSLNSATTCTVKWICLLPKLSSSFPNPSLFPTAHHPSHPTRTFAHSSPTSTSKLLRNSSERNKVNSLCRSFNALDRSSSGDSSSPHNTIKKQTCSKSF